MDGSQIFEIVSKDPCMQEHFRGIFARDRVPRCLPRGFYVWNTAKHSEKGEHWVAVHVSNYHKVEFFDSFGKPPTFYGWNISGGVKYNKKSLQSINSSLCGMYALFYIYFRCYGIEMESILAKFGTNTHENDSHVLHFVQLFK